MSEESKETPNAAEALVASLRARYGDPEKALRILASENFKLRDKNRELKGKIPGADVKLLSADDAKLFDAFKALNLKPEEVTTKLTERDTLETQIQTLTARDVARDAAETLNYKANVLLDLMTTKAFDIEFKDVEVEVEGKKEIKRMPHAKVRVKDAKPELLSTFAERELKDYLPSLAKEQKNEGVTYPEQDGSRKAPTTDVAGKILASAGVLPSERNKR